MRQLPWIFRALIVLLAGAAAAAPAAAGIKDGQWWGSLEGLWAQPTNLGLDPGVRFNTNITDGGTVLTVPFDHEYSTRLRAGWRDGDGDNTFSISMWTWDHGASMTDRSLIIPTLSDPVFGNVLSAKLDSTADVTARIVDLMVSRKLASTKKGSWYYGIGIRHASFRQHWDNNYFDIDPNNFTLFVEEQVNIKVFTDGTGITTGIGSSYQWSRRWRTSARAQLSLLSGSTDSGYLDKFVTIDPNSVTGFTVDVAQLERNNDRRVQQQLELEARVSYNVWKTLDVSLGYTFLQWSDVSQFDRFFDDVQSAPQFRRENVAFQGLTLGVSYWF
jgi:major outer membrane protein